MHFYKPAIEQIGVSDSYYFIADDVFLLTGELRKLGPEELEDLPVTISWKGPRFNFSTDAKECLELLINILYTYNLLQPDKDFVSFPVGEYSLC